MPLLRRGGSRCGLGGRDRFRHRQRDGSVEHYRVEHAKALQDRAVDGQPRKQDTGRHDLHGRDREPKSAGAGDAQDGDGVEKRRVPACTGADRGTVVSAAAARTRGTEGRVALSTVR